jgi:hypothetical protein
MCFAPTARADHSRVVVVESFVVCSEVPMEGSCCEQMVQSCPRGESSGGQRIVALRLNLLYCSGAEVNHHVSKASFGFCLAIFRRYVSVGRAPSGSGSEDAAFASLSACSLPGMSVWPGIQRTCVAPCDAANAWNSRKTACEESDGVPRRHVAAARLSRQTTISRVADAGRFSAALRPSSAPVASASKTSAGPRRPEPSKMERSFWRMAKP